MRCKLERSYIVDEQSIKGDSGESPDSKDERAIEKVSVFSENT